MNRIGSGIDNCLEACIKEFVLITKLTTLDSTVHRVIVPI